MRLTSGVLIYKSYLASLSERHCPGVYEKYVCIANPRAFVRTSPLRSECKKAYNLHVELRTAQTPSLGVNRLAHVRAVCRVLRASIGAIQPRDERSRRMLPRAAESEMEEVPDELMNPAAVLRARRRGSRVI